MGKRHRANMQCAAQGGKKKLCLLVTFVVFLSFPSLFASLTTEIPTFLFILPHKPQNPVPESNSVCPWSNGELNLSYQPPHSPRRNPTGGGGFPINSLHRDGPMKLPGQLFTDATNRPLIIFSSAPLVLQESLQML